MGYESNIHKNALGKEQKYRESIRSLSPSYCSIKFINMPIGTIGFLGQNCKDFPQILTDMNIDEKLESFTIKRIANICIRCT